MKHYLRGLHLALYETLRQGFKPRITQGMRSVEQHEERYRASFALTHNEHGEQACIACMQCSNVCPSHVIEVTAGPKEASPATGKKRGWAADYTLNLQACILCEMCVQVCPTDAIVMVKVQEKPGFSREDLVLTMDKLYANAKARPLAWANGSILREMQDPKREVKP
ncbi:MAG: 4Fe-4S dicluster domain-containing protein [Deltaproteobacteria bacterium]|nr:4Fe-4S dicluster domain-containing protein [Deltaproteobacteria bacterium]